MAKESTLSPVVSKIIMEQFKELAQLNINHCCSSNIYIGHLATWP
jgi:hypothetical protein